MQDACIDLRGFPVLVPETLRGNPASCYQNAETSHKIICVYQRGNLKVVVKANRDEMGSGWWKNRKIAGIECVKAKRWKTARQVRKNAVKESMSYTYFSILLFRLCLSASRKTLEMGICSAKRGMKYPN
jgi:hypothetical protein